MDITKLVTFSYIPIIYKQIQWLNPITNPKAKITFLCQLPYENHPKGCPNFGSQYCPPSSMEKQFILQYNLQRMVNLRLFLAKFDFELYQVQMRILHSDWTPKRIQCCLYYQTSVKKQFFQYISNYCNPETDLILGCGSGFHKKCHSMEAMGINVFSTLKNLHIPFEVKPKKTITFVSLVGSNQRPIHQRTMMDIFTLAVIKQPNKEYIRIE